MSTLKISLDGFALCAILLGLSTLAAGQKCNDTSVDYTNKACQCAVGSHFFDFSSLAQILEPYAVHAYDDNKRIKYTYLFNPCNIVVISARPSGTNTCQEASRVAVCQHDSHDPKFEYNFNSCGSIDGGDAEYIADKKMVRFFYPAGYMGRHSYVYFLCDPSATERPTLEYLGEGSKSTYSFRMNTSLACIKAPAPSPVIKIIRSISVGTVLCLIVLFAVILYFGGFACYSKFAEGRDGPDLIPHRAFWTATWWLIKDGAAFVMSCCCYSSGQSHYENL